MFYSYRKLKAHQKHNHADKVQNIRVVAKIKSFTHSIIPVPSQEWHNQKAKVMEDICLLCARQSDKYYQSLIDTGNDHLVHNMEADPCWGFGRDCNAKNLLGKIRENVRNILHSEGNDPHNETNGKSNNSEVEVISDLILIDTHTYLLELDIKSNINSSSGKGAIFIASRVGDITAEKKPKHIMLHMGTNGIEHDDFQIVETAFRKAISGIKWASPSTKIILSGLTHRIDRTDLNYRIDFVNNFLHSNSVIFMNNNATFRNIYNVLDNRDLRPPGYGQIAQNIQVCLIG